MSAMTKCPNCGKTLKLKSEAAFGKKTACPQCREPFTVKPYRKKAKPVVEEPEDEYDDGPDYGSYDEYDDQAYDDYGGDGQHDDYEPAPKRSASSKSSKKSSKKKKKAAGMPPWLKYVAFGLAGVLVVGGLAGAIVMAVGSLGGGNVIDLAWLPEDADLFVKVEPDELWNAPMLATVRDNEMVKNMMEQATQQGGVKFGLSDIDSVTMAGLDMSDTYQQQVGFLGKRVGRPTIAKKADAKMVGVVRFKKDITPADLGDDAESRKKDHGGKSYYSAPDGQAVYLADARTMLVGQEGQVTAAMDRGPTEPRVSRIDFVNPRHQLLFVIAPPKMLDAEARSQIQATPSSPSATPAMQKVQKSLNDSTKAFAFGLSLTSDIKMEVQMQCFSSSEAESLKTDLDTALAELKTKFESSTGQMPPQFADFAAIGKETIDSLSAKKSGDEVSVAMQVPGRITTAVQDAIASNPMAAMMLQGMTQQFNQPPESGSGEANAESLNPSAGGDAAQAGQPSNANSEDFEAGVRQDQQNTLDTLNGVRSQIKKTTGALQDSVPGGK